MDSLTAASALTNARSVVIKIGSALLADLETGSLRADWLSKLVEDVARLQEWGCQPVIVSSGAVALGRAALGLKRSPRLDESQAAAAAGQILLAGAYQERLQKHGINAAQILLTPDDTEDRRRYVNARNTLHALMKLKAVPIINENDTVATAELRYGDNDRLAARVATMIEADMLIILSDVDGLYTSNPREDANAAHIPVIDSITEQMEAAAGGTGSHVGSGGMKTKIDAAKIATAGGVHMVIAKGTLDNPLKAIAEGAKASLFTAQQSKSAARKQWILGSLNPGGRIVIDDGAAKALNNGKSLLPAGVKAVEGEFQKGDAVDIVCLGDVIARGIVSYDAADAKRIIGLSSDAIAGVLGEQNTAAALIHRNHLAMMSKD